MSNICLVAIVAIVSGTFAFVACYLGQAYLRSKDDE